MSGARGARLRGLMVPAAAGSLPPTIITSPSGTLSTATTIAFIRDVAAVVGIGRSLVLGLHVCAREDEMAVGAGKRFGEGVCGMISIRRVALREDGGCLRVRTCRVRCSVRAKQRPH